MTESTSNYPEHQNTIASSGLFDGEWYVAHYPEVRDQVDPLEHFCHEGWQQGLQPNPYFHTTWYTNTYGAEFLPGENPLLHYIRRGERENAWPSPHFDTEWYQQWYEISENESPLRHYLLNRTGGAHSPLPVFDVAAYVEANPECLSTGEDPFLHSLQQPKEEDNRPVSESPLATVLGVVGGSLERGDIPEAVPWEVFKQALRLFVPLIPFDEAWYCRRYPDVAAAVKCGLIASAHGHFVDYGFFEGRSPASAWSTESLSSLIAQKVS